MAPLRRSLLAHAKTLKTSNGRRTARMRINDRKAWKATGFDGNTWRRMLRESYGLDHYLVLAWWLSFEGRRPCEASAEERRVWLNRLGGGAFPVLVAMAPTYSEAM